MLLCVWAALFLTGFIHHTFATCAFPVTGIWETSDKGTLTFSSTQVSNFPTTTFGTLTFTCDTNNGEFYMAKSPTFTLHGVDFEVYICLKLTMVTNNKYQYYMATDKNSAAGSERLKSAATAAALNFTDVCDRTVFETGSYNLMILQGQAVAESIYCPAETVAKWSYTFTDSNGNSYCTASSQLDVCSQNTTFSFDYTKCSQDIMYSSTGTLLCVHSIQETNNTTYVTMYNSDVTTNENTTYRFTCLFMESTSNISFQLTQHPQYCLPAQTVTSVTSPGASLVFTYTNSCDISAIETSTIQTTTSPSSEVNSASILLGIFIPLILITTAVIIIYFVWRMHQKKIDNTKPNPDPKFANGEVRNKRLNVQFQGATPTKDDVKQTDDCVIPIGMSNVPDDTSTRPSSISSSVRQEASIVVKLPTSSVSNCESLGSRSDIEEEDEETEHEDDEDGLDNSTSKTTQTADPSGLISVGVDTRDIKSKTKRKKKGRKTTPRYKILKRTRSSVSDSSTLKPGSPAKEKASERLINALTQGTNTVLLNIQPPKTRKSPRIRKSQSDRAYKMDKIKEEEPLDAEERIRDHRMRTMEAIQKSRSKKKMPVLRHPMEIRAEAAMKQDGNNKHRTGVWMRDAERQKRKRQEELQKDDEVISLSTVYQYGILKID